MRSRPFAHSPECVLLILSLVAASAWTSVAGASDERVCGTDEPTPAQALTIQNDFEARTGAPGIQSAGGGVVQVAFHVIHNGVEGNVTDEQIAAQVAELNLDFSGASGGYDTGYRFVLSSVDRTLNSEWFDLVMGSNNEKRAKETLGIDPVHHINIYTARISSLGWSSFPWGIAEDEIHQGIVVHYGSLPGGDIANFNMGRTVTHEVGHYFGLLHTFFTGCQEPNDYVTDTPAQASQTSGCPADGLDTCPLPGADPIHNFLDYSWDICYAEFTPGQDARMDGMLTSYKPNLIVAPLAVGDRPRESVASLRPVVPSPSGHRVRLSFALRQEARVTLRIHDLAGRVVARLADGVLPRGEHVRTFQPTQGGSGVYFAELVAGDERLSRRLVVTH